MDNLETQETLSTRNRTWKNGQSRDTGGGRMGNLETQETLSPRDRMWKNGQSGDTGNIKRKRQNVEKWTI
jgi:hypothetical protein